MDIAIDDRVGLGPEQIREMERRLRRVLAELGCSREDELSVVITDDADMARLNSRYLDRQGPTNVIAFPMGEGEFSRLNPHILGDVVVSLDTARREAAGAGLDPGEHLMRLLIHGVLHLRGYDHEHDPERARRMYDLTERLLERCLRPGQED